MDVPAEIISFIPHRPPFLWVDRIISCSEDTIVTEKTFSEDLDIYQGHYPNNPITPGVLLCEAVFQSGAVLMAKIHPPPANEQSKVPVLTRINGAKFKRGVYPGDTVRIKVQLKEKVASVFFLKGVLKSCGKTALQVDFACAMADRPA
ncbi:3-hydroxyacyl-ACP dehydratase FabZ family protein [Desulforhopalus singaporensis]|uniref:3-hydroxyacyl-[acyl-carrier-protein] dehydratase n=1 Tax=Desulforhopalus singaporensis TaxID=91360 RepID=A0A1H0PWP4_9BACT|nr:3-hydroxyacyl-ACP dehydratase FabZ family protein [Desulforhopalus singaporensis]SDP09095.1 3-hydroxyacyl-[acyl-carrier-protein] dehydratase [Desulforhopalus singaporensis]